jgi:integrase/recombinase XerD
LTATKRSLTVRLGAYASWMDRDCGYAQTTRATYLQHVEQAERFFRREFDRSLVMANEEQLRIWLASFRHPKTRNSHLIVLRSFFRFARERGLRATDPTLEIRRFTEPRYLPRPLNGEDVARLRVAAQILSLRHQVIVDLALYAGPRRAEIAGLSWSDVDFHSERIRFRGKGAKEGIVPLHPHLAELLWLWRSSQRSRNHEEWVFPSDRGGHLKPASIWLAVHQAGDAAGFHLTTHQLRHTYATELLERGSDIRAVQELMRHSSLQSTQIYTKVSVRRLEADVARLNFRERVPT